MTKTRYIVLAAIIAAFIAAPFVGRFTTESFAQSKGKGGAVKYSPITSGTYNLDKSHGVIGFAVRHYEINWVEGRFNDFSGAVNFDEKDVSKSTVEFSAKIDSVDTAVAARDGHLKSPDFFDAAKFPELTFKSTKVTKKGAGYIVEGDFTMKGVTKRITFPFTLTGAVVDGRGNRRFGIEATTVINRRDFGVTYGGPMAIGGVDIGNEVTVNIKVEAVKPEPKK